MNENRAGRFDSQGRLINDRRMGDVIATYEHIQGHMQVDLVYNCFGTLYRQFRPTCRIGFCQSMYNSHWRLLEAQTNNKEIWWLKTPGSLYHCWHVCMCPACTTNTPSQGGRAYEHSQASWNEHLKHVSPSDIFTFPTVSKGC